MLRSNIEHGQCLRASGLILDRMNALLHWQDFLYKGLFAWCVVSDISQASKSHSIPTLSSLIATFLNMFGSFISVAVVALAATASAAPKAAAATSCTLSGASGASAVASAKASCPTLTLDSLVVPAGTTLDLTKLAKVWKCFELISFAGYLLADLFTFALTGHPCHFQGHYHLWIQGVGWPSCLRLW